MTLRKAEKSDEFILVTPNDEVMASMLRLTANNLFALGNTKSIDMKHTFIESYMRRHPEDHSGFQWNACPGQL
jgi:hypothetical protein